MPYAVYILKCSDGSYYTGLTKDLDGRVREHETGKGWSRAKKEALIRGDVEGIHEIVKAERKRKDKIKRNNRTERSEA